MESVPRICLFALVALLPLHVGAGRASNPRSAGAYPVGVRTEIFVDSDRICPITHKQRTLVTEFWYPAAASATTLPVNRFEQFWPGPLGTVLGKVAIGAFGGNFIEVNQRFKNNARRDAKIAAGKFPLLVFSHGNGGFRFQNTYQMEYLAAHGYVVAACDHTGNAAVTLLPQTPVIYTKQTIKDLHRWDDRPRDLSFLITRIEQLSMQKNSWLFERIERGNYGALGHSFGGFTVCRLAEMDPRVKAILPMTLAGTLFDAKDLATNADARKLIASVDIPNIPCKIPLLVILGDHDRTVGDAGNQRSKQFFERAVGPRYLLMFKDAGHFSFTDMTQINPNFGDGIGVEKGKNGTADFTFSDALVDQRITNQYTGAFFDTFLRHDDAAKKFLDANQYPEELGYERENKK